MLAEALKRCPICSSINQDPDLACGVCQADISHTPSVTLEVAESLAEEETRNRGTLKLPRSKSDMAPLVVLLAGGGLIVGAMILFENGPSMWPLLAIFAGMLLVLVGVENLFVNPVRPIIWRVPRTSSNWRALQEQADRDEAERKKMKSGEAD